MPSLTCFCHDGVTPGLLIGKLEKPEDLLYAASPVWGQNTRSLPFWKTFLASVSNLTSGFTCCFLTHLEFKDEKGELLQPKSSPCSERLFTPVEEGGNSPSNVFLVFFVNRNENSYVVFLFQPERGCIPLGPKCLRQHWRHGRQNTVCGCISGTERLCVTISSKRHLRATRTGVTAPHGT